MQDEDALVCDLAEYYSIHDYRLHGVSHIATLTAGLPAGSRTMKGLTGQQYGTEPKLLALIIDLIQTQMWVRGGKKGAAPQSLFKAMSDMKTEEFGFDSPEEFEQARKKALGRNED